MPGRLPNPVSVCDGDNQHSADLKQVKFALVRADLQDGLVADVQAAVHCGVHFNLFVNATSASMSCLINVFVC